MRRIMWIAGLSSLLAPAGAASAGTIYVGSGVNQAQLWIEFKDGGLYTFEVAFGSAPSDTVAGLGLFDVIEAETSLYTVRQDFGFGTFIDGIYFDGHGDEGYGGGDDWWHYWTAESNNPTWTSSGIGVGDRIVEDGDSDGWVYGKAYAPGEVPEPGALGLLLVGAALTRRTAARRIPCDDIR